MNKLTHITASLIISSLLFGIFFPFSLVQADNEILEVEFENRPLFKESNLFPGSQVTRWVEVTNNSSYPGTIFSHAKHTKECLEEYDCITRALNLEITGNDKKWQGGFLEFFESLSDSPADLGTLEAGESVTLEYTLKMDRESGNKFQDQTTEFDLFLGLELDKGTEGEQQILASDSDDRRIITEIETEAANDRPSNDAPEDIIEDLGPARVIEADPEAGTAELHWTTKQPTSSRIMYGAVDEGSYQLNSNDPPSFGYPQYGSPASEPATDHTALLSDLEPGTDYYYRLTAQSWPMMFSPEYTFTMPAEDPAEPRDPDITLTDTEPGDQLPPTEEETPAEQPVNDEDPADPVEPAEEPSEEEPESEDPEADPDDRTLASSLAAAVGQLPFGWLLPLSILFILILILLYYLRRRSEKTYLGDSSG